jgi:hypothetical protein
MFIAITDKTGLRTPATGFKPVGSHLTSQRESLPSS